MKKYTCSFFLTVLSLAAAAVLGLSSCHKEIVEEVPSGSEIRFGAENGSFVMEAETKASTGTTEVTSLGSFKVAATTGSAGSESSVWNNVSFSGTTDFTGGKTWPASDPHYTFYATNLSGNTPMTFNAAGTTISAANTQDVVCAYLPDASVTYKAKNVLSFEHIFARITNVVVVQESGYTISSVSVSVTPKTGGTYNLRTGAGQSDGTGWSGLTTGSATTIASAVGTNTNDVWLVPGQYTITASWTATQSGGSSVSYSNKTVNVDITGGKKNTITATLGGEMVFGVSLESFDDNEVPLAFGLHQSSSGARYSYAGGSETLTLSGYSGTWTVAYSTDGGSSFSGVAPTGVTVTRTSANQGSQVYSIALDAATATATGVALGTWPSDSRHTTSIGTPASPVDLSLLDVHGDILAGGRTTANTYVVHAPGTYMIPLVYGNAITNGSANSASYIRASGSDVVAHFHNAYDSEISSPYIETDVTANSKTVSSADLVWSTKIGLVDVNSALETHGGIKYLVFSVDPATIDYGNAVVCVKDNSGTIVWSWLVWVYGTELWDETIETRVSPAYEETHFMSAAIGTMPPAGTGNIYGAFDCIVRFSTAGGQQLFYTISRSEARVYTSFNAATKTPFYQYGRPTPAPPTDITGHSLSDGNQVSMATALQNPGVFYTRSASPYNWCSDNSSKFYNVWNNNQNAADQNKDIIKTIYDPSPAGYSLPKRNAFTFVTTTGSTADASSDASKYLQFNVIDKNGDSSISSADFVRGWYFKRSTYDTAGYYVPASGYRGYSSGGVSNVGSCGYYWSSSPSGTDYGRSLYFHSTRLNPLYYGHRANGFSVLPARIQ